MSNDDLFGTENGMFKTGSKVRVIRSRVREELIEGLYLPAFNFNKTEGPQVFGEAVFRFLKNVAQEELWTFYLDADGALIALSQLHIGTGYAVHLDRMAIIRHVIDLRAREVIIVHARTGADSSPNEQDAIATKQVAELLALHECRVLDHIIVSNKDWTTIQKTFPKSCSHVLGENATERAVDPSASQDLSAMLGGMNPALVAALGKLMGLPDGAIPDMSVPPIDMTIDFSSPEKTEEGIRRVVKDITESRELLRRKREGNEIYKNATINVTTPQGTVIIGDDDDIEALVREVIIPLQKGEKPLREPNFSHKQAQPSPAERSLAEQLKEIE